MLFDSFFPISLITLLTSWALLAILLLAVYLLLRGWQLQTVVKYAHWQAEAQAVEGATHDALYRGLANDITSDLAPDSLPDEDRPFSVAYPRVAIVLTAYNQADRLEEILPLYLQQSYQGRFEVVVVDQRSNDDTLDVLTRLALQYQNLRFSTLPATTRQIEPRKLALTLAIKAAHSEWVIVVKPTDRPPSNEWLQHFAQHFSESTDFIEAYSGYEEEKSTTARQALLERLHAFSLRLTAYDGDRVLDSATANYAVRRSCFLEEGGFTDSLTLPFGEESLFVANHISTERLTMLCLPETRLREEVPTLAELKQRRIMHEEVLHRLPRTTCLLRLREGIIGVCYNLCLTLLFWLLLAEALLYFQPRLAELMQIQTLVFDRTFFLPMSLCLLGWGASIFLPIWLHRRTMRVIGEPRLGWSIVCYEFTLPFRRLATAFRRVLQRESFVRSFL